MKSYNNRWHVITELKSILEGIILTLVAFGVFLNKEKLNGATSTSVINALIMIWIVVFLVEMVQDLFVSKSLQYFY